MSWYDATMPFQDDHFHIVSHSQTGDARTTETITRNGGSITRSPFDHFLSHIVPPVPPSMTVDLDANTTDPVDRLIIQLVDRYGAKSYADHWQAPPTKGPELVTKEWVDGMAQGCRPKCEIVGVTKMSYTSYTANAPTTSSSDAGPPLPPIDRSARPTARTLPSSMGPPAGTPTEPRSDRRPKESAIRPATIPTVETSVLPANPSRSLAQRLGIKGREEVDHDKGQQHQRVLQHEQHHPQADAGPASAVDPAKRRVRHSFTKRGSKKKQKAKARAEEIAKAPGSNPDSVPAPVPPTLTSLEADTTSDTGASRNSVDPSKDLKALNMEPHVPQSFAGSTSSALIPPPPHHRHQASASHASRLVAPIAPTELPPAAHVPPLAGRLSSSYVPRSSLSSTALPPMAALHLSGGRLSTSYIPRRPSLQLPPVGGVQHIGGTQARSGSSQPTQDRQQHQHSASLLPPQQPFVPSLGLPLAATACGAQPSTSAAPLLPALPAEAPPAPPAGSPPPTPPQVAVRYNYYPDQDPRKRNKRPLAMNVEGSPGQSATAPSDDMKPANWGDEASSSALPAVPQLIITSASPSHNTFIPPGNTVTQQRLGDPSHHLSRGGASRSTLQAIPAAEEQPAPLLRPLGLSKRVLYEETGDESLTVQAGEEMEKRGGLTRGNVAVCCPASVHGSGAPAVPLPLPIEPSQHGVKERGHPETGPMAAEAMEISTAHCALRETSEEPSSKRRRVELPPVSEAAPAPKEEEEAQMQERIDLTAYKVYLTAPAAQSERRSGEIWAEGPKDVQPALGRSLTIDEEMEDPFGVRETTLEPPHELAEVAIQVEAEDNGDAVAGVPDTVRDLEKGDERTDRRATFQRGPLGSPVAVVADTAYSGGGGGISEQERTLYDDRLSGDARAGVSGSKQQSMQPSGSQPDLREAESAITERPGDGGTVVRGAAVAAEPCPNLRRELALLGIKLHLTMGNSVSMILMMHFCHVPHTPNARHAFFVVFPCAPGSAVVQPKLLKVLDMVHERKMGWALSYKWLEECVRQDKLLPPAEWQVGARGQRV